MAPVKTEDMSVAPRDANLGNTEDVHGMNLATGANASKICRWPLNLRNVRKLPIVGDVHLGREEWPSLPEDWEALWGINP